MKETVGRVENRDIGNMRSNLQILKKMVSAVGIEPTTY